MTKKIAIILSGCGNKDGSEIHESVSLIINLSKLGAHVDYFAPDINFIAQNFLTNEKIPEQRNIMVESSRISRSQMRPLSELRANQFDALALPGGFGAALHLSNWASAGAKCKVLPELEQTIIEFHKSSKPIGAICIAPTLVARVLGSKSVTLTIGDDKETIAEIKKTGAIHEICPVDDYVTDRQHKIITTPAYMYDAKPHQVFEGIRGLAEELFTMS